MIELVGRLARATVSPLAAMVVDGVFLVGDREHRPLARAPWIGEPGLDEHPGHLRILGGDFVGLPFGASGEPAGLDPEWRGLIPAVAPEPPHGRAAEEEWEVVDLSPSRVRLVLDYPADSPIERVERTIAVREDAPALDFELVVRARRAAEVSLALHPILRLPAEPRALSIEVPFGRGFTYPGRIDPGAGPTAPWREFSRLDAVPARPSTPGGASVDLSRVPLEWPVQDNVLLADVTGPVVATYSDTGTRVTIDWDRAVLPHVMVWLSDGVIDEEPWRGRYRGLGVEPLAAAFDFADAVSTAPNPLTERGVRTAVRLDPQQPLVVRHSWEVSQWDANV